MDCRDCESVLVQYAMGELSGSAAQECESHVEGCEACKRELSQFGCLVSSLSDEPEAAPTVSESARLRSVLDGVMLPHPQVRRADDALPQGFPGFVAACVLAFAVITSLLSLAAFGVVDVRSAALQAGPCALLAVAVVVVFLTSFVPIAVTARRRPLNGMTFRR